MLVRITKREARQRFATGQHIVLCPCKFVPDGPWSMGCTVFGKEWRERAEWHTKDLTHFDLDAIAWDLMYNNWAFYNATHETGYYAHYYKEDGR